MCCSDYNREVRFFQFNFWGGKQLSLEKKIENPKENRNDC